MKFSISKCVIINVSLAHKKQDHINYSPTYSMEGIFLSVGSNTRYLGVVIASDLKRNIHIYNITAKATKMLNFIK